MLRLFPLGLGGVYPQQHSPSVIAIRYTFMIQAKLQLHLKSAVGRPEID